LFAITVVDLFYEVISSACNHDPDMSPSKPVRPQIFNELHPKTPHPLSEFLHLSDDMQATDILSVVRRALAEDLPDITSESIFNPSDRGSAMFVIKAPGILAGLDFAAATFAEIDPSSDFQSLVDDGAAVAPGDVVAKVESSVIALLSGERTALNLMQRASGIATATRRYVDAIAGTKARIYDTRKTAPGLRLLDKYAVQAGGGENHRMGLHDMFLVKNNHIDRAGSIAAAVERIRARGLPQKIMVEVRDTRELDQALTLNPDLILLDNMTPGQMRAAVERTAGRVPLEASGGITIENVREYAETGVDRISIGALTHSVKALDISMRIQS
jgi:nicotinate-nucleotide pyrophosphorylase (carboxylating)